MKKKLVMTVLAVVLSMSMLAGCGSKDVKESETDKQTESVSESETEEDTKETEESEVKEDESESEETEKETSKPAAKADGLSDKYVDMDNRSFAVNGKVYTLGVTTLQKMIDDGVPFDEDDLANANNNLNPNSESSGFKIVLGEYYNAQVSVLNASDSNASMASLPISSIYLPVNDDYEQDILEFSFPLDMTEDDLLKNAGEPTDKSEYKDEDGGDYYSNTYEYTVDSTKYFGDSGYTFEFINGALKYVTIDFVE